MKIATTTGDFNHYCSNDSDRIRELHRAGFRYIDLSLYSAARKDNVYMNDGWQNEVEKIRDTADSLGMKFVQAHSPGVNPFNTADDVDFMMKSLNRSIEICGMLGIKNTVVHSGIIGGIGKEEWFRRNKEFYGKLFPEMEKHSVNVLVENSTKVNMGEKYFINSGKDTRELVEFIDHPLIHACWDTGHANCEGNQYDEILSVGNELYAIHYNDNHGKADEHLIPYFGTLNHDEVINALIDTGYKGYFTLECSSSLILKEYWLGSRRKFQKDERLSSPPFFAQQQAEKLLYDIAKHILTSYGIFEE